MEVREGLLGGKMSGKKLEKILEGLEIVRTNKGPVGLTAFSLFLSDLGSKPGQ